MTEYQVTLHLLIEADSKEDAKAALDSVLEGGIGMANVGYSVGPIRKSRREST